LENNVRLYRVVQGRRIEFASANARAAQGRWQRFSIEAVGTRITVSLNEPQLINASDSTFAGPGRVGPRPLSVVRTFGTTRGVN
jgi:hypothetical protein